jgi:TetR/AcrR family transcriptional regulator, lmrAB and yxaGH operons repressor
MKDTIVPQLVTVFQQYGYEGATLARLSKATGLGRASLYHHFPRGKEEMATHTLNYINREFQEKILAPLRSNQLPIDRLGAMNKNLDMFYCQGEKSCLLELLTIGEAYELFQNQIQQLLELWIGSLTEVMIQGGIKPKTARQRAENAILQIEGALVLTRGLNNREIFKRVLNHLPEMLLSFE